MLSKIDATNENNILISYLNLRKSIGFLGIFLPLVLVFGSLIFNKCTGVLNSISEYYYTSLGPFFVGTLSAVSLFLFCYNGYNQKDKILSKLACAFGLGIAFFPTILCKICIGDCYTQTAKIPNWCNSVHNVSAALFFLTLAYISFFQFTKTRNQNEMTIEKKQRNIIFKVCAVIMMICILSIGIIMNNDFLKETLNKYQPTFFLETIALWAFGTSWLIKGEFMMKDK
jgi:MFS family permease